MFNKKYIPNRKIKKVLIRKRKKNPIRTGKIEKWQMNMKAKTNVFKDRESELVVKKKLRFKIITLDNLPDKISAFGFS